MFTTFILAKIINLLYLNKQTQTVAQYVGIEPTYFLTHHCVSLASRLGRRPKRRKEIPPQMQNDVATQQAAMLSPSTSGTSPMLVPGLLATTNPTLYKEFMQVTITVRGRRRQYYICFVCRFVRQSVSTLRQPLLSFSE